MHDEEYEHAMDMAIIYYGSQEQFEANNKHSLLYDESADWWSRCPKRLKM